MASNFTSGMLYESAYSIPFNWKNHLPECVYKYHELIWKETNAPIELHMGVVLPFVSACLGPRTKGHFLTRPSVLNLFWINVAASGVGKSVTRHRFISELLDYIIENSNGTVPDFQISRFTRPGTYSLQSELLISIIKVFSKSLHVLKLRTINIQYKFPERVFEMNILWTYI